VAGAAPARYKLHGNDRKMDCRERGFKTCKIARRRRRASDRSASWSIGMTSVQQQKLVDWIRWRGCGFPKHRPHCCSRCPISVCRESFHIPDGTQTTDHVLLNARLSSSSLSRRSLPDRCSPSGRARIASPSTPRMRGVEVHVSTLPVTGWQISAIGRITHTFVPGAANSSAKLQFNVFK